MFPDKISVAFFIFFLILEEVRVKHFALKPIELKEKYLCNKQLERPGTTEIQEIKQGNWAGIERTELGNGIFDLSFWKTQT